MWWLRTLDSHRMYYLPIDIDDRSVNTSEFRADRLPGGEVPRFGFAPYQTAQSLFRWGFDRSGGNRDLGQSQADRASFSEKCYPGFGVVG